MGKTSIEPLSLEHIDNELLDGLDFCKKVYDLFDAIRASPEGRTRLRFRQGIEKKLLEEAIPIACYIQARYREGRRIKIRWKKGSQSYDAVLYSNGELVNRGIEPRRNFVEATMAVPTNDYLVREHLTKEGHSYAAKGTKRDPKTKQVISEPYVFKNDERVMDLVESINSAISMKSQKRYPSSTVLIVTCISDGLLLDDEWSQVVTKIKQNEIHESFREVFLISPSTTDVVTLYGKAPRSARRIRSK